MNGIKMYQLTYYRQNHSFESKLELMLSILVRLIAITPKYKFLTGIKSQKVYLKIKFYTKCSNFL